ncbi:uncharacterized protein LOC115887997 [Sitophilus oryzae]|uniref:Uncharacterized protein LOC115887997 n=1 Tax=Sitophilus oryzae TaxID=7048 RepID=A0A6J2YJI0_SITOR|nr:uncharacterized protein LOC115887997 [Sitophilus oryzae]
MEKWLMVVCIVVVGICSDVTESTTIFSNAIDNSPFGSPFQSAISPNLGLSTNNLGLRQTYNGYNPSTTFGSFGPFSNMLKRRCPICDSSVYGYCSEKLFHDSCCCNNPNNPYEQLPYQCQYADCSFLHANSCREHKLITACCCTNFLFYRK